MNLRAGRGTRARIEVALEAARAGLRTNRRRTATAVTGLALAVAVTSAGWRAEALGGGGVITGALLLGVIAAAVAAAVDPRQLRASAVLDLGGATRGQRRLVVVLEALVLALAALPFGVVGGEAVVAVAGGRRAPLAGVVVVGLGVPVLVALFAGRARTRVTAVDARGEGRHRARRLAPGGLAAEALVGVLAVWAGWALAASADDWFDLDLFLWPGLLLAGLGLGLLLPALVELVTAGLDRLPWLVANVDGALLRSRRRLLTPALLLGTVAALAVAVHGVLGAGLAEREQRRHRYLDGFRFTAGLDADQVIVAPGSLFGLEQQLAGLGVDGEPTSLPRLVDEAEARLRAGYPGAEVTGIDLLPRVTAVGDPRLPDPDGRDVAVATPELLAALGLERYAPDLAAGRAVALDPTVVRGDGTALVELPSDGGSSGDVGVVDGGGGGDGFGVGVTQTMVVAPAGDDGPRGAVPAVVADLDAVPLRLPALLVPPGSGLPDGDEPVLDDRDGLAQGPNALVVRLPGAVAPGDARQMADLVRAGGGFTSTAILPTTEVEAWAGDAAETYPYDHGRLDDTGTVGLRRPGEVRSAVAMVGLVALLGVFVTLRLAAVTRRSDEDVIEALGARPATLRRLAVLQATVLAALATSLGLGVGIALTRLGIGDYNRVGRFGSPDVLPPIPVVVPGALWVGLVAVPVVAGVVAWLLARAPAPAPSPAELADGLLW